MIRDRHDHLILHPLKLRLFEDGTVGANDHGATGMVWLIEVVPRQRLGISSDTCLVRVDAKAGILACPLSTATKEISNLAAGGRLGFC